ncbi:MAG: ABC transporter ATP-binding protein/permease [Gemmatimonadetes bacterium]|nr:ABC transporter ATP-binding protein/permease [Gemmatimonadota bacterium]
MPHAPSTVDSDVLYRRILGFLKPHARVATAAVLATFVFSALDAVSYVLLIPFMQALFMRGSMPMKVHSERIQHLLDATVYRFVDMHGDPLVAVGRIILLMIILLAVKNVFDFTRAYLVARTEQGVNRDLRNRVYDHVLDLDLAFFSQVRMGQIVSRLTTEIEQLRTLVTSQLSAMVSAFFAVVTTVCFMILLSTKLTVTALVVVPLAMLIWWPFLKRLRRGDRRVLHLGGEVNAHIQETLSGIRLVKSASAEDRERSRFHGLNADYFRNFMRTTKLRSLAPPMTEMMAAIGTMALLWVGAREVVHGALSGAEFVAFLALSLKLFAPVKNVAKFPAMAQPGLVAAERVFEFLDAPVEIRDRSGARPFPGLEREITFEHVSFSYRPGESVLEDVSFTVPRGSVVALVGSSGAGKSTVVDLLGRFFEVTDGRIAVDGVDIRDIRIKELRAQLGIVSQETVLFHDTVRANIAYGRDGVTPDEDIVIAAKAANAHDFVSQMPQGYDTVVGERGTEISGGQRQRIAIARAILRDPPILIFDEATSALDTESERLVQAAIERLLSGRTVFVIAHRLSTVQRADQILVLSGGRIVERGNHATLLAGNGFYRRLYELQFEGSPELSAP